MGRKSINAALNIALRNLLAHKSKTLIIGGIILLSSLVITAGNLLIVTVRNGMFDSYSNKFTGEVVIVSDERADGEVLPSGMGSERQALADYAAVTDILARQDGIRVVLPQLSGMAMVYKESQMAGMVRMLAADPQLYGETFVDTIEIVDGYMPDDERPGIMLDEENFARLSSRLSLQVGDTIQLSADNDTTGSKIRLVSITGLYRWKSDDVSAGPLSFIDLANLRILNGLVLNAVDDAELSQADQDFLANDDFDALFGTDTAIVDADQAGLDTGGGDIYSILGDTSTIHDNVPDPHGYHHVILRLDNPAAATAMIAELNRLFAAEGIGARAVDWVAAAGTLASLIASFQIAFNAIVLLVSLVAIIIIMNTMVISIAERIGEIGTLRAIGARKSFIIHMIFSETALIAGLFGGAGILFGCGLYFILAGADLTTDNMLLNVLFSSLINNTQPFAIQALLLPLLMVVSSGALSGIYPAWVAADMSPLNAMKR